MKHDIAKLLRPNIRQLKPYSSARHEFKGEARILLDANENPFGTEFNRYPDPLQVNLKRRIGLVKGIAPDQIFLGNGSDEAIDLLIKLFCRPGVDHIIQMSPTYGMYQVSADIAEVEVKDIPLDDAFQPRVDVVLDASNPFSKILLICNPNNPTGNCMEASRMKALIRDFPGIVAVDEAYIDFAAQESAAAWLPEFPNLVVLQTFSKAWGMAGIRLGMALASPELIRFFNKVKPPYNVNMLTQAAAMRALEHPDHMLEQVDIIRGERRRLERELEGFSFIDHVFPSDTNFLLLKTRYAEELYRALAGQGIIVRDRSGVFPDTGALRVTVGLPAENDELLAALHGFRPDFT